MPGDITRDSCACFASQNERQTEKKKWKIGFHTNYDLHKKNREKKNKNWFNAIQMHLQRRLPSTCAWRHSTKLNAIAPTHRTSFFFHSHYSFLLSFDFDSRFTYSICIALVTLHCFWDACYITAFADARARSLIHRSSSHQHQRSTPHYASHYRQFTTRFPLNSTSITLYIFIVATTAEIPASHSRIFFFSFFCRHNRCLISLFRHVIHLVLTHRWTTMWTIERQAKFTENMQIFDNKKKSIN